MSRGNYLYLAIVTSIFMFFFNSLHDISFIFSLSASGFIKGEASWPSILFFLLVIIACLLPVILKSKLTKQHLLLFATCIAVLEIAINTHFIAYDGLLLWVMLVLEALDQWLMLIVFTLGILSLVLTLRTLRNLSFPSFVFALSLYNVLNISEDQLYGWVNISMTPFDILYIVWSVLLIVGAIRLRQSIENQEMEFGIGVWTGLAIGGFLYLQVLSGVSLSIMSIFWSGEILLVLLIIIIALLMLLVRKQLFAWILSKSWSLLVSSIFLVAGILLVNFTGSSFIRQTSLIISYLASFLLLLVVLETDTSLKYENNWPFTIPIAFALALNMISDLVLYLFTYLQSEILKYFWLAYVLGGLALGVGAWKARGKSTFVQIKSTNEN
jgi:hypothetical protein